MLTSSACGGDAGARARERQRERESEKGKIKQSDSRRKTKRTRKTNGHNYDENCKATVKLKATRLPAVFVLYETRYLYVLKQLKPRLNRHVQVVRVG